MSSSAAARPDGPRWCYECRRWPGAKTGDPNRVEMCKSDGGNTRGFAGCDKWQHVLAPLSPRAYEENLLQHGIVPWGNDE